ncbi:hypothetical protein LUZ61_008462 [Rhynchospora tenuis]|uniref:Uncharacterized protein n=1 Tax=Rhynchospora tenuis TaxID=198213 RepID=A0AAD6EXH1_9POAL|nr:hypothetical protein LUZ61_008462 [Rhynchospora tenuis]
MRTVEILQSSLVVPSEDTPREKLVLSNLDLVAVRKRNNTVYLFKNTEGAKDFFSVEVLKTALAKALVLFYPFAGRHVVGSDGRDLVDCNAEGVLFVVARLDCTADSIQSEPMSPELEELFVPKVSHSSAPLHMSQIRHLKIRCSEGSNITNVSTFVAVTALVWKCYCIAQGLAAETKSRLYFTADIRNRIQPPISDYFGNGVIRLSTTSEVSKITSSQIGVVAGSVKAVINGLTDEFVRSFIDYVEVMRDKKMSVITDISESDLRVRTIIGIPIYDIDFGWGNPQVVSWERFTENRVVYLMNEPGKDAGIKVVVALDSPTMKQFQKVFYEELLLADEENNRLEFSLQ